MKLLLFVISLLTSHARRLWSLVGMAVRTMDSVAEITVLVLLVGKSVRTPGLQLFHALVMSPLGDVLGFLTEPLV